LSKKVKCKARVNHVEYTPKNQYSEARHQIRMNAVWAGSSEAQEQSENAIFGKHTPQFDLSMCILNDAAAKLFVPDAEYYVTFELAKPITAEQIAQVEETVARLEETIAEKQAQFQQGKKDNDDQAVAAAAHDLRLYSKNLSDATYALAQMRAQVRG
jgi:hypothetical protein